jgi:integrase
LRRLGREIVASMREIGEAYNRAVHRVGLQDVTWHTLRHTWASWHVMNRTPLEVLQKLGGSSLNMVLRYAHPAPEYLASWANNAARDSDENSDGTTLDQTDSDGFSVRKGHPKVA